MRLVRLRTGLAIFGASGTGRRDVPRMALPQLPRPRNRFRTGGAAGLGGEPRDYQPHARGRNYLMIKLQKWTLGLLGLVVTALVLWLFFGMPSINNSPGDSASGQSPGVYERPHRCLIPGCLRCPCCERGPGGVWGGAVAEPAGHHQAARAPGRGVRRGPGIRWARPTCWSR